MNDYLPKFGDTRVPLNLWDKVYESDSGCWVWTAATTKGYGTVRFAGTTNRAHRLFYQLLVEPLPKYDPKSGIELDHLCNNKPCVRPHPKHVHRCTQEFNLARRTIPSGKDHCYGGRTHCSNGHEYTAENTAIRIMKDRKYNKEYVYRQCRTCERSKSLEWYYKNKAQKEGN